MKAGFLGLNSVFLSALQCQHTKEAWTTARCVTSRRQALFWSKEDRLPLMRGCPMEARHYFRA